MFSYEPLWATVKNKGIKKKTELIDIANISPTTLSKLSKNEYVSMDTLGKLCRSLDSDISSIVTYKDLSKNNSFLNSDAIRIVSLFSGIGGFEEGINNSGLSNKVIFSSEIDDSASQSYLANFPDSNLHGDITKVDVAEIPSHDLLVAGFPCQSFSIAGKGEGFEDEARGTLFFDILRVLNHHKPKYILLENVKNLISHDRSKTIHVILESLSKIGYTLDFTVVNSREAGVAQNRDRTYIVGILNYESVKYNDDFRNKRINNLKSELNLFGFSSFNFFDTLKFDNKQEYLEGILESDVESKYYFDTEKVKTFLKTIEPPTLEREDRILKLFDIPREVINDNERQRRVYSVKGLSPTLLARSDTTKILEVQNNELKIRKLTPIENMKVQGFDDEFIDSIKLTNVSDTQLYKQSGNAVSPPVITGIIEHLQKIIDEDVES